MLGGAAIWLSVTIAYLVFIRNATPHSTYGYIVINAGTFLFIVGLADDLVHTKPYQKLIGQIMGAAYVIYYGLSLPWTRSASVNLVLTIFWLIGITNAINLLDNMVPLGRFDVIFCRNVLIYFDQPTKTLVLDRLSRQMAPDGHLYLGGAETVLGISDRLQPVPDNRGIYSIAGGPAPLVRAAAG